MKLDNSKNAVRIIYTGIIARIVTMLLQFVFRTFFIYRLGAEYLGLNSLFSSILNVLNLTELGICSSIIFCMYKPIAENDTDKICSLMNFFRKCYYVIGAIILILGLCCIPFLKSLILSSVPNDINIYLVYLLVLGNTVASYYMYSYKVCLLTAFQRTDLKNRISIWFSCIQYTVQILLIFFISNYYIYLITNILFNLLLNFTMGLVADRYFPNLKPRGRIDKETRHEIIEKVKGMMAYKIAGVVSSSFDTLVMSAFLGLTLLGKYNNYDYISSSVASVLGICTSSITAGIGNNLILKSKSDILNEYFNISFIYYWIAGSCSICLLCLSQSFMEVWVGNSFLLSDITVFEIAILFFLNQVFSITDVYRNAAGLWDKDKLRPIISAVANLCLNLILVRYWAEKGVLLSTIVTTLIFNIGWGTMILFKFSLKCKSADYYKLFALFSTVTILIGAITYYLTLRITANGIIGLAMKSVFCLIVPNILYIIILKHTKQFNSSYIWMKKVIHNVLVRK